MTLRTRLAVEWLIIALLSTALVIILILGGFTQRLDNLVYDIGLSFQSIEPSDEIIVIAIDEPSLEAVGSWPWPRTAYVPLIDMLDQAGAGAVAIDILFTEPHDLPEDDSDSATVNPDQQLADALQRNGKVALPMQFLRPGSNGNAQDRISPIMPINEAAAIGHVELITDDDTVVRRMSLCLDETADRPTPHMMVTALNLRRRSQGEPTIDPECDTAFAMPFLPASAFRTTSFSSAANGEVPADFFRDKIVLVGVTAVGLGDQHRVPAVSGEVAPGIIVMANALNALIQDRFIAPAPLWGQFALALLPLWLLLALLWRARPRTVFLCALALLFATLIISLALLQLQIWFAPIATMVALILVYPLWGWRRLQSASDYMGRELDRMDDGVTEVPIIDQQFRPADIVTEQTEKLSGAIAKLRDMRRFVSDTLTNLPDPMVVVNEERHIVMANEDAEQMLGRDLMNTDLRDRLKELTRPDSRDQLTAYLNSNSLESEEDSIFEFRTRQDHHYAMRRSPVLSSDSERLGTIFYFADITDIRRADREREEVLQLLSHDMRGPQAAILALLDQNRTNTPDALRQRIVRQARRTLSLADNFVDIARMTAQPFTPEDVLFGDLVAEASEDLWPLASTRDIRFALDDRSDAAFIAGEHASLSRAFVNLFDNAVKYSPDHGTISVTIDRITLDNAAYVRCIIEDEGRGIDKPIMERLFTAFASTRDMNKASKITGVGLGLHYVQTVIVRHGGEISADNRESSGARFTLLLPMLDEEFEEED